MKTLTITYPQSDLLSALQAEASKAMAQFQACFAAIIRGHDITTAELVSLEGALLTIKVPEPADVPAG